MKNSPRAYPSSSSLKWALYIQEVGALLWSGESTFFPPACQIVKVECRQPVCPSVLRSPDGVLYITQTQAVHRTLFALCVTTWPRHKSHSSVLQLRLTYFYSPWQSHPVNLCGLPPHDWSTVAPGGFHYSITTLTVDQGISRKADICQTDLLERCHLVSNRNGTISGVSKAVCFYFSTHASNGSWAKIKKTLLNIPVNCKWAYKHIIFRHSSASS